MNFLFRQSGLITRDNIEAAGFECETSSVWYKWMGRLLVNYNFDACKAFVYSEYSENTHDVHLNTYEQLTELLTFLNDNEL